MRRKDKKIKYIRQTVEVRISLRKVAIGVLVVVALGLGLWFLLTREESRPAPVPRHKAYVRVEAPAPLYREVKGQAATFDISAAAALTPHPDNPGWYDVVYPSGGFTLYISSIKVPRDELESNIASRLERMRMNVAGSSGADAVDLKGKDGFEGIIITAPASCSTPVQLLMADSLGSVFAATMFISDPAAASDAELYRPQVEFVKRDLLHLASEIRK